VVRVNVNANRWHIVLVDLARDVTLTFNVFTELAVHLELEAARSAAEVTALRDAPRP